MLDKCPSSLIDEVIAVAAARGILLDRQFAAFATADAWHLRDATSVDASRLVDRLVEHAAHDGADPSKTDLTVPMSIMAVLELLSELSVVARISSDVADPAFDLCGDLAVGVVHAWPLVPPSTLHPVLTGPDRLSRRELEQVAARSADVAWMDGVRVVPTVPVPYRQFVRAWEMLSLVARTFPGAAVADAAQTAADRLAETAPVPVDPDL
jgi:hypothetical protein